MPSPEEETNYVTLTLHNPSPYPRGGFVVRAWEPIAKLLGGNPKHARVYRELDPSDPNTKLKRLDAQVDELDPDDPDRTQLVFELDGDIGPGHPDYISNNGVVRVMAGDSPQPRRTAEVEKPQFSGIKLRNEHLEFWINTAQWRDEGAEQKHYAGAVTYVNLFKDYFDDHPVISRNRLDALDAERSQITWDRDPEQRAMQIDRIHLVRPPWDERGSFDVFPYQSHWSARSTSQGPVRATATIVSEPFDYSCADLSGNERLLECRMYRSLSLYSGEEIIGDTIWIKAVDKKTKKAATPPKPQRIWFTAGLFMMVNFTKDLGFFRYPNHPGWFTIYSKTDPNQGYAFATDARTTALWTPPLDYPVEDKKHRAFSWEIGPARVAHCFHAFRMRTTEQAITDYAGLMWYTLAFKRIRATLEGEK
jgi:LmbE family N-acetylglucosaminyl deacetylase